MRSLRPRIARVLSASPALLAGVVGTCFLAASLAARLFVIPPEVLAPVWPAGGVLMFALLRTKQRRSFVLATVAAFAAGLAANLLTSIPLLPSLMFSAVNCVGGIVGSELLKRKIGSDGRLNSIRNLAMLLAYGAGVANAIGATCGAALVAAFGLDAFAPAWMTWWLSNALGVMIVLPLASEGADVRLTEWFARWQLLAEVAVLVTLLAVVLSFGFGLSSSASNTVPLLVFPVLVWVGLRFNVSGAATVCFVMIFLALFLGVRELASFAGDHQALHSRILQLQMFMIMAVVSSLIPAAALAERKRAEESLRDSETSLRTVFDSVYDGIILHDEAGTILDVNQRSLAMYGLSATQFSGITVADISSPSARTEQLGPIWAEVMTGHPQFFEWKAQRPHDGFEFDVEVFLRKIRIKGQAVIMANIRDISARKRAEMALSESEARLRLFIDHAPAAIAMLDRKMCYLAASHRWLEDYGLTGEIVGRCHYDIFSGTARTMEDAPPAWPRW